MEFKFKVEIRECERGWGSRLEDVKEFDTYKEAFDFILEFNKGNNQDVAPSWYMIAMPLNFTIV